MPFSFGNLVCVCSCCIQGFTQSVFSFVVIMVHSLKTYISLWRRLRIMVGFKNRYMVMEVFLDPDKDLAAPEPITITQFNLSKAIKDSILLNFGECGLASSVNSFQG